VLGLLTVLVFYAGMASFFLTLALYLQHGRGLSALAAGATFSSLSIGNLATSLYAQRLMQRLGWHTLTFDALGMALGLILLGVTVAEKGATVAARCIGEGGLCVRTGRRLAPWTPSASWRRKKRLKKGPLLVGEMNPAHAGMLCHLLSVSKPPVGDHFRRASGQPYKCFL
jgi:hypothetical protein